MQKFWHADLYFYSILTLTLSIFLAIFPSMTKKSQIPKKQNLASEEGDEKR
jgi:hypothetical protein